jgi:hypothetical protein
VARIRIPQISLEICSLSSIGSTGAVARLAWSKPKGLALQNLLQQGLSPGQFLLHILRNKKKLPLATDILPSDWWLEIPLQW